LVVSCHLDKWQGRGFGLSEAIGELRVWDAFWREFVFLGKNEKVCGNSILRPGFWVHAEGSVESRK